MADWLALGQGLVQRQAEENLLSCNDWSQQYGLRLSAAEARALVEAQQRTLRDCGRMEMGSDLLQKMAMMFANSPFLEQETYVETLEGLVEIFYEAKIAANEVISDDDLLHWMRFYFDGTCQGSLTLLAQRELAKLAQMCRDGLVDGSEWGNSNACWFDRDE